MSKPKRKKPEGLFVSCLRNIHISPRKARLAIDLVRGKTVQDALDILRFTNKKSARLLFKVLNAAMSAASEKGTVDVDRLFVAQAFVDGGSFWKRYLPRARGVGHTIRKRTSHITVRLKEL